MKDKLKAYILANFEEEQKPRMGIFAKAKIRDLFLYDDYECEDINTYIDENNTYNRFQTMLFKLIDERNLKDSDVYNKVHIDRRLFSKIRSDINYHPSKETVILLGISLELSEEELIQLLDSASYSLPKNNNYDLIIRFCFINKIYDIDRINDFLSDYNCKLFSY